jgi:hypothetical protein
MVKCWSFVLVMFVAVLASLSNRAFADRIQKPDTLWTKSWIRPLGDGVLHLRVKSDGGYLLGCLAHEDSSDTSRYYDIEIISTDSLGNMLWDRRYGNPNAPDYISDLAVLSNGRIAFVGMQQGAWVYMLDESGDSLWSRSFDQYWMEFAASIKELPGGDLFISGTCNYPDLFAAFPAVWIRMSQNGTIVWRQQLAPARWNTSSVTPWIFDPDGLVLCHRSLWQHIDSNLVSAGSLMRVRARDGDSVQCWSFQSGILPLWKLDNGDYFAKGGSHNLTVMVTDTLGIIKWEATPYDFLDGTAGWHHYCRTPDGGCLLVGAGDSVEVVGSAAIAARVDSVGQLQWTMTEASLRDDWGYEDVVQTPDGGYCIAGGHDIFGQTWTSTFRLIKLAPDIKSSDPARPIPQLLTLGQNYPNPFNPTTQIHFSLARSDRASVRVFDLLGREVAVLSDAVLPAGEHSFKFDGSNFASGVYLYRVQSGALSQTRKMVLLK